MPMRWRAPTRALSKERGTPIAPRRHRGRAGSGRVDGRRAPGLRMALRLGMGALIAALGLASAPRAAAALACAPLSLQKTTLRFGPADRDDRLGVAGEFTLPPGGSIDPATETTVLSLLDRSGPVFVGAIAPGAFRRDAAGRTWRFSDPAGQQARGVRSMRISSTDGVHFRWKAQARNLELAAASELDLEVVVAVGGDCARAIEPCARQPNGRSLVCRPPSPGAPAADIEVATRGRSLPLPEVVGVGTLGWDPRAPWATLQPYAPAAHLGLVRLYTLDPSHLFDRTSTTAPTPAEWAAAEDQVRAWARDVRVIAAAGYQPAVHLCCMPRWLSLRPSDESVHPNGAWLLAWAYAPPASLSGWYDLVHRLVSVIASEGLHLPYQVWDEPDWMHYGTLEDYVDLYEVSARAIRAADPLARVGGPGLSNFAKGKDVGWALPQHAPEGTPLFLPAWIAEAGRRGAPIDFVDWHFPTTDPDDGRIDSMVGNVRVWLAAAGYDPAAVRLRIGEWLDENCGEEAASLSSAAEIVPMLSRLAAAGVASHAHTSFTDQANWSDGCWTHVGLFSGGEQRPRFLVRAKLNVFRLVSWLGTTRLPVARRDPLVEAIVTESDAGYEILLANAASTAGAVRASRRAAGELAATGEIGASAYDALLACWDATLAATVVRPSGTLQACLAAAVTPAELTRLTTRTSEIMAAAAARQGVDWSGTVRVAGLRSGSYDVERALVDHGHGNVCAYNKATEPVPSSDACGAGGAADQAWAAVRADAEEAARAALRARGYAEGEIAIIEADLVAPCRVASATQGAFLACVDAGLPALAAQLGRAPGAMTADLHAALAAYDATLDAGELAAAAALNALPEVTSRLEPAGRAVAADGRLDLAVSLPPDGVLLLRLRPAE